MISIFLLNQCFAPHLLSVFDFDLLFFDPSFSDSFFSVATFSFNQLSHLTKMLMWRTIERPFKSDSTTLMKMLQSTVKAPGSTVRVRKKMKTRVSVARIGQDKWRNNSYAIIDAAPLPTYVEPSNKNLQTFHV